MKDVQTATTTTEQQPQQIKIEDANDNQILTALIENSLQLESAQQARTILVQEYVKRLNATRQQQATPNAATPPTPAPAGNYSLNMPSTHPATEKK